MSSIKSFIKYFKTNILGTKSILDSCKNSNVKNFIFSSTAAVYGKSKKIKVNEKDQLKPISNYGLGKLICEKARKRTDKLKNKFNGLMVSFLKSLKFSSSLSLVK